MLSILNLIYFVKTNTYMSTKDILDKHAHKMERTVTLRKPTVWATADIKMAKTEKLKAANKWRKTIKC